MRLRLTAALLLLVAVGCSAAPPASTPPMPTPPPLTPWQSEVADLPPDGVRSLDSALRLMVMAFGPIPGVAATTQPVGAVMSASPAVRSVTANRDQLSDEQQAAVDEYLAIPANAVTITIPPASEPVPEAGPPGALAVAGALAEPGPRYLNLEEDIAAEAQRARSYAARYFGDIPELAVRTYDAIGNPFVTFFNPTFGPDGFRRCDVIVNRATANYNRFETRRSLTMDVVHCFQSWAMGSEAGFMRQVPAWAWEGPAQYIWLESSPPVGEDDQAWWATYVLLPDVPLFERSYDAIGFYSQLRWQGVDLPSAMQAVLTDVDNPERFALAGAAVNPFLDAWASGLVRNDWGRDWIFDGPDVPSAALMPTPRQPMTVGGGDLELFSQEAYSNHLFDLHVTADIVVIEVTGRARVGDGTVDVIVNPAATFCVTDQGCQPCPESEREPPPRLSADSILAVSGGTDGTSGTVRGISREDECETPRPTSTPATPPPATPRPGGGPCTSCPMSNGDPHIVTINDVEYDFMATGEYVLLQSAAAGLELQARQEPYFDSDHVSINTALALRAGGGPRIGLYIEPVGDVIRVLVDGAPADPVAGPVVAGDATITHIPQSLPALEIALADGTRVMVLGQPRNGVNVTVDPSAALRSDAVGLMGPVMPGSMGVPALPDGTVLPAVFGRDEFYADLYGQFADAWRVSDATSLFDYEPGRSSASYVTEGFPDVGIRTFAELSPEELAAGEAVCGHISVEMLRAQCVYDVAVTGSELFGDLYDLSAQIVKTGSLAASGQRVRVVNFYSNDTGPIALDVYGWSDDGAALMATVPFGESSAWFDPGTLTDPFGTLDSNISIQRTGEAVNEFQLNLVDLARDAEPGLEKTIVISSAAEGGFSMVGGRQARQSELIEESAGGLPLMDAPPGGALLFINVEGLLDTHPAIAFFTSAGDGCLGQPGFEGMAQLSGVTGESGGLYYQGPLALAPGDGLALSLHAGTQADNAFEARCDKEPIHGPLPFSIKSSERSHFLLYAVPGDPTLRSLVLPFGH